MMEEIEVRSKVYIQTDAQGRVTRCDGGYTMENITGKIRSLAPGWVEGEEIPGWILIDEGTGDRYNLCQTHYFEGGLYTADGIPRWVYEDGAAKLRTDAEIEADRPGPSPESEPTEMEELRADVDFLLVMGGYEE